MSRVEKAIETGRCAIAVSESLLRDPTVMLALTERAALTPMALAGTPVAPLVPVSAEGIARAVAQPGGVLILVEPDGIADLQGVKAIGELLQRGRHKPDVLVVSRQYNPLAFMSALRGLKIENEKSKGREFLTKLPQPPAAADEPAAVTEAVAKVAKGGGEIPAPRFCFVGRDEELEALGGMLAQGGPIVVSGPDGVGRTQLVEHAIAKAGLKRLPDVWLGWGTGADTLAARIGSVAAEAGDTRLWHLLKGEHSPPAVAAAAIEALNGEALAGSVLVIHNLEYGLGREGDFFRKSRLELLLQAMLTGSAALPVVFVSTRQPVFHREGEAPNLRRLEVGGLKGRFLHEIFDAYKALEFPRDKFGPISERIHGHPLAARTMAITTRVRQNGLEVIDDPKFLKMDSVADLEPLRKQLAKRVEKLPKGLREVLATLAHLRIPCDGAVLSELGVGRKERLELMSLGLLDLVGTEEDRKYRVHPMVRMQLTWREVSDFGVSERLAELYANLARKVEGAARVALEQEQNRFAVACRALRLRVRFEVPDHDMWLESAASMLRAKAPRLDLVEQRVNECLKQNPHNSDAWLLKLELVGQGEGKGEAVEALLEEALAKAPVPELLHQVAGWTVRRNRNRTIAVLEKGLLAFPGESRLHTRLAGLLLRQGRRNEAIEHLRQAMEIDPMLPDAYGLLGQARRDEGRESLGEAETLLREAVRLTPNDPVQLGRLVDLLMERARIDQDQQAALHDEAKALLEDAIKGDRRAPEACLLYATLVRESGGDLERASWLLNQAKKLTDRGHERSRRIGVERALIDMAKGNLDAAENALRQHIGKDPSHARAFAALGHVLEAREQFLPAHLEYQRAKERTAQNSLECEYYDQQLRRVQGIIEAQAAGLWVRPERPEPPPTPAAPSNRVLRRRKGGEAAEAEAPADAAAETEGGEAAEAPAPAGSDDDGDAPAGDDDGPVPLEDDPEV